VPRRHACLSETGVAGRTLAGPPRKIQGPASGQGCHLAQPLDGAHARRAGALQQQLETQKLDEGVAVLRGARGLEGRWRIGLQVLNRE
jgi:hypothetical protein